MANRKGRGTLVLFWLRTACFLLLLSILLAYLAYVLTPKHDYGMCSMVNLYQQDRDTVDVLVLGTSLAYAGVNTNVLWRDYGVAAYNLCSAEQPFWVSYYYLREALRVQTPSLILLDAKPAVYPQEETEVGRAILATAGIRSPVNRWQAIRACVGPEKALSLALRFPYVHTRYAELTGQDFAYPPDNGGRGGSWKGYIERNETQPHERPSVVWNDAARNLPPKVEEYARRIMALAEERGIPLLVVGFPNPDYENDHLYYNALAQLAREYGAGFVNYNDPRLRFGLRYSSDFADWQHLNVKGSVTFTTRLGQDLRDGYALPDRRGDAAYSSYEACAAKWFAAWPDDAY